MSQFLEDLLKKAKTKADNLGLSRGGNTLMVSPSEQPPDSAAAAASPDRPDLLPSAYHAIATLQPPMPTGETRVYLYLLQESLRNSPHERQVTYNQRHLMQSIGMTSPTTLSRSMKGLQKRRLLRWIRKAQGRGKTSIIEVCLPWERL